MTPNLPWLVVVVTAATVRHNSDDLPYGGGNEGIHPDYLGINAPNLRGDVHVEHGVRGCPCAARPLQIGGPDRQSDCEATRPGHLETLLVRNPCSNPLCITYDPNPGSRNSMLAMGGRTLRDRRRGRSTRDEYIRKGSRLLSSDRK
jgi:hypothetical protein